LASPGFKLLQDTVINCASLTELVTLEERKVITADLKQIPVAYLASTSGALYTLRACDPCRVDMLAWRKPTLLEVGALATLIPEIDGVVDIAEARRHEPGPASHVFDLIPALVKQGNAALFASGAVIPRTR